MCKHEQKKCPRCEAPFECKVGDITHCQCYGVQISVEEEAYIRSAFADCLCRNCLLQLKDRYQLFREQKELYNNR
jgi:hypothetical protein